MKVKYRIKTSERKKLAQTIGKYLNVDVKYLGAPTFAYKIGALEIDCNGNLTFDAEPNNPTIQSLVEHLNAQGYNCIADKPQESADSGSETESQNDTQEPSNVAQSENVMLTVAMPRDSFTDDELMNLQKLVNAKGGLIKKALSVDNLPIEIDDEKVSFPWFLNEQGSESVKAYTHFITAICDMARNQKRITVKEKTVDNEKYAFRCFLLRLGFIGNEFKTERKILLKNFTGSSAFKNKPSTTIAPEPINPEMRMNIQGDSDMIEAAMDTVLIEQLNAEMVGEN